MSRDPGVPVELEAFTHDGRALWRRPLAWHDHCFGNANNVPVVLYDLDGDGRAEVAARLQQGEAVYLAVLDGLTGRVLRKTAWPEMVSDFSKSSPAADGNGPAILVLTNTAPLERRAVTRTASRQYRLWMARNMGGGYPSYFEPE